MRRPVPMIIATLLSAAILIGAGLFLVGGQTNRPDPNDADSELRKPAPELSFTYFDSSMGNLVDFRGKPTVINFFASWCGPCVLEMPDFQDAFLEYGDQVNFVGFNTQDKIDDGRNIVATTGVTYVIVDDSDGTAYTAFGGFGMPTTVLLDGEGGIVEMHTGLLQSDSLREKIETELLS